jgi:hypothetical protein
MYRILLTLHSANRWLVLFSLVYAIALAARGVFMNRLYTAHINLWRHLTATFAHLQLLLGLSLYVLSPIVKYKPPAAVGSSWPGDYIFFRYMHLAVMVLAIVIITIGSAKAKRMQDDEQKFRTMLVWFLAGLLVILVGVPWPFSPLSSRPFWRSF